MKLTFKPVFTLLIVMAATSLLWAAFGSITVVVTDGNGDPIAEAIVTIRSDTYSDTATTGTNGEVTFTYVPYGTYYINVEVRGMGTITDGPVTIPYPDRRRNIAYD